MRISAKSRYGLASMIKLAEFYDQNEIKTIGYISEQLSISKIYLEQVFSLLKKNEMVVSIKGPTGGYLLAKKPSEISAFDILSTMENSMFDESKEELKNDNENIEKVIIEDLLKPWDEKTKKYLSSVTLESLVEKVHAYNSNDGFMYYL